MTAASASCRERSCQVIIKCCSGNRSAGQRSRAGERAMGPGREALGHHGNRRRRYARYNEEKKKKNMIGERVDAGDMTFL